MNSIANKQRVDWFRVLVDLKRAQLSLRAIEDLTGISRSSLDRYKAGGEPTHADGERLIQLWCEATGIWRDHLPMMGANVPDSGRALR